MTQKYRLKGSSDIEIEAERTWGYGYTTEDGVYDEPIVRT